jgi:lysylphosphatidylglycerol synthetase-like protein (DUF2156 family)
MAEEAQELDFLEKIPLRKSHNDRSYIVELVRRWGGSTSDAVLEPTMQIFQHRDIEGFIAYRPSMQCAIVFGDPICSPTDRATLAIAFHRFAEEKGYSVIYIAASQSYAHWAVNNVCGSLIEFGQELIFTPPSDPRKNTGTHASLVRRKTKQAHRQGVTIHEYIRYDPALENAIDQVKVEWLNSRQGLQVHISNVYLFTDCLGKRWFYAKLDNKVIGVIALNHLQARNGWLLNHLMVVPDAPNGVSELLMATALETLEKEGCPFASIGSIASSKLGEIRGLSALTTSMTRVIFKIASKIIHLKGLNTFWGKFYPQSEPSYLIFSRKRIGIRELLSLKRAMSGTIKERLSR